MKILKWLLTGIALIVLVVGIGVVALVYLVDWNNFKETIQTQVKNQTGRDLVIAGDLSPSVFPWAGISIGEISLANAEGFGDEPFAEIQSADVKVEVMPLLRRSVNIRTVELNGLKLDLQVAADGTTNWDDLTSTQSTTTTVDEDTSTEVEGNTATIAALEVGGIQISDANVHWRDAQGGTDARLSNFNLDTGAIALQEPFELSTDFTVASDSMALNAEVEGGAEVTIDLENQLYSVSDFNLTTDVSGEAIPGEEPATIALGASIVAAMNDQTITVDALSLEAFGVALEGTVNVADLNTEPQITGQLGTNEFSPRDIMEQLAIELPETADPDALKRARLSLALAATPASAAMNDLLIELDNTRLEGSASVPTFEGAMPPLRFDLAVDDIDLDRYLPPPSDVPEDAPASEDAEAEEPAAGGDVPIELPVDLMRDLDVDGEFRVGNLKASNLTVSDIAIPIKAAGGKLGIVGMQAALYEGAVTSSSGVDVTGDTPAYSADVALSGIQADPLLADLLQDDSFLSGKGDFNANITTVGDTVDGLTAALDGGFDAAFLDGAINGINIGFQLRRAKAALTGQKLDDDEKEVKTDFSSLTVSGVFDKGVMDSQDLDVRSPLLRLAGAGQVDLPQEQIDYTLTTLVTGTAEGQGGSDLDSLKGLELDIPIRGSFTELAEDPAGVILDGLKEGFSGNIAGQAEAAAKAEAERLKAKAQEELAGQEEAVKEKVEEELDRARDKAKDKLKSLLK